MSDRHRISYSQLELLLNQHKIETRNWCHQQGYKTIEQLWDEIQAGECNLEVEEQQLVRKMQVASIEIKFKLGDRYFQLIEDQQIFFTGQVRRREVNTVTEKIKAGETPLEAAYRGLAEEVGLSLNKGLRLQSESTWHKISPSYPDLMTAYQVFNYAVILGKTELQQVRFSEYVEADKMLNLFTLKPDEK